MSKLLKSFSSQEVERAPGDARVVAVASGKGGVGKTSLVVNLSLALAELDRRVVILDADLGLANVEVLMGVTPLYTLRDCLCGGKEITEILTPAPLGVQIISGGSGFLELAHLSARQQQKIVAALDFLDGADFILVDTGAGISKNVLGFLAAAGEVIVVLTPEPTSLTDGYALIKILAGFGLHRQVMLVVNRAADEREGESTAARIKAVADRFLQIDLVYLGTIVEDRAVRRAVRRQEPYVLWAPQSPAAQAVRSLARRLAGAGSQVPDGRSFSGFLAKVINLFR
ncbi:MAG: MinD/ParA family protein [Desulfotomaculales bacterium]